MDPGPSPWPVTELAGGRVRRTAAQLADGRQILYFDDTEPFLSGATRHRPDMRQLNPAEAGSILRYDVLTGEWIAIASHRNERTFLPPKQECPLCPSGRETHPSEIPADDYDVVVFENRFPSFSTRRGARRRPRGRRAALAATRRNRPVRGRVLHLRPPRLVRAADPAAGPDGHRGVGRPHGRAQRDPGGGAGLLLREPGGGDRGHAASSARSDLRLPVRHPTHRATPGPGSRLPTADGRSPAS